MRNSLKISTIILVLAAMIAGSSSVYASGTRMGALGMDTSSFWMISQDTTTTAYFPSYAARYPGLMAIRPAETAGAIFLKFGDMALWLNGGEPAYDASGELENIGLYSAGTLASLDFTFVNYSALLAYKMGAMGFGLKFGVASAEDTDEVKNAAGKTLDEKTKSKYFVALGFDMDMGGRSVDLGLNYSAYDYAGNQTDSLATTANKYEATPTDFNLFARFNMALNEVMTLHAFFNYQLTSLDDKYTAAAAGVSDVNEATKSSSNIVIGVSDELKFGKDAFSYVGLLYKMKTSEIEQKDSLAGVLQTTDKTTYDDYSIKAYLGTQAKLTKGLSGCIGIHRVWDFSSTEELKQTNNVAGTTTTSTNDRIASSDGTSYVGGAGASWGLVYTMGHFKLEANMTASLLKNGPDFISGAGGTEMASSFNIVYVFGNPGVFEEDKK